MSTTTITVTINGEAFEETVPVRMLLVDFIRERAALTGTHIGCTYEGSAAPARSSSMGRR